jgi:hypothetical protein
MKQDVLDEIEAIVMDVINDDYEKVHEEMVNNNWNEVSDAAAILSKHAFALHKFKKESIAGSWSNNPEPFH